MKGLSVVDARARMLAAASPLDAETIALADAAGRVLASPVTAGRDQPPFHASAMDGWAVAGGPGPFAVVGESAAGRGFDRTLGPGEAVRVFTGAPIPPGATRVVMQEEARLEAGRLVTPPEGGRDRFIRPRGGDFRAGDLLLPSGAQLDPWRLSLVAAAGLDRVRAARRPRIAILTTGEELAEPGGATRTDQIFDSAGPGLAALVRAMGASAVSLRAVGDDAEAISRSVAGADCDLVVTVGGASVGDHDLVKPALVTLGLQLAVETVNVRPGKPTWFGRLADGRLVLGLPGNPASAFVCAELFLRPLVRRLLGAEPGPRIERAPVATDLPANGAREHWMRARIAADGRSLEPFPDQDSSLVTVLAGADALVCRPAAAPALAAGDLAEILRLTRL